MKSNSEDATGGQAKDRHDHDQQDGGAGRHGHDHAGHSHHHGPLNYGRSFALGVALNLVFIVLEAIAGLWSGSLALLADAGHNLSDVGALMLAWAALVLARRPPTRQRTYGLGRGTILASLGNALTLLLAIGAMAWEAIGRLHTPPPVATQPVILVALVGVAVNGATAWLFAGGRRDDVNLRGAFLHMAADAAVSLGVALTAVMMSRTGWLWLDPAATLVICAVIVVGTWGLLRESFDLAMDAVPRGIDREAVEDYLAGLPGVTAVHDLHIWALSSSQVALTAHLIRPEPTRDRFIADAAETLRHRFGIAHCTIQIERGEFACELAPAEVV